MMAILRNPLTWLIVLSVVYIAAVALFSSWFDEHQGAVQAALIGILVIVTAFYAFQTKQQAEANKVVADETKLTREFNEQPELAYWSVPRRIKEGAHIYIPIQNVGNGPARQVKVECWWKSKYYLEDSGVPLLGRDHRNFLCVLSDDEPASPVEVRDQKDLVLLMSYLDLNKNPIQQGPEVIPYHKMKAHLTNFN